MKASIYVLLGVVIGALGLLPFRLRIEDPVGAQEQIYTVSRFTEEAQQIIEEAKSRTGATVTVVGIYDPAYDYRILVAQSGEPPANDAGVTSVVTPGHREILEEVREGDVFFTAVDRLPESPLRTELEASDRAYLAASAVYDPQGYLMGYVAFSWLKGSVPIEDTVSNTVELTANELTRLSRIFG